MIHDRIFTSLWLTVLFRWQHLNSVLRVSTGLKRSTFLCQTRAHVPDREIRGVIFFKFDFVPSEAQSTGAPTRGHR